MLVWLWDLATGQEPRQLRGHTGWVRSVTFSPNGRTLASAGIWEVRLWDPVMGQLRAILRGHTSALNSVAFSPDGQTLVSGSWDRTVRLWRSKKNSPP
jgi:WD40 repeat protein